MNLPDLNERCRHLAAIHPAPEACWPLLIGRMLAQEWTIAQTSEAVAEVRNLKAPRGYEKLFPL
jgi:hypothetical protein